MRRSGAPTAASRQALDRLPDALGYGEERLDGVAPAGQVVLHLRDLAAHLSTQRHQLRAQGGELGRDRLTVLAELVVRALERPPEPVDVLLERPRGAVD